MTEAERKIIDAAREWTTERQPQDVAEKALFAAVFRAYPEDACTKETCGCGTEEECDECPCAAEVEGMISKCEQDVATAREQTARWVKSIQE